MRTIVVDEPTRRHAEMHAAAVAAVAACEAVMRPGHTAGEVFDAHARVVDEHGMKRHRLSACGYSLGAKFTPSRTDPPMFHHGNPFELQPGMVMSAHMILMDSDSQTAMTLGCTYIVGDGPPKPLSRHPVDLIVR